MPPSAAALLETCRRRLSWAPAGKVFQTCCNEETVIPRQVQAPACPRCNCRAPLPGVCETWGVLLGKAPPYLTRDPAQGTKAGEAPIARPLPPSIPTDDRKEKGPQRNGSQASPEQQAAVPLSHLPAGVRAAVSYVLTGAGAFMAQGLAPEHSLSTQAHPAPASNGQRGTGEGDAGWGTMHGSNADTPLVPGSLQPPAAPTPPHAALLSQSTSQPHTFTRKQSNKGWGSTFLVLLSRRTELWRGMLLGWTRSGVTMTAFLSLRPELSAVQTNCAGNALSNYPLELRLHLRHADWSSGPVQGCIGFRQPHSLPTPDYCSELPNQMPGPAGPGRARGGSTGGGSELHSQAEGKAH